MKKLLLTLMVFVCAVTCAFGLAACNNGDEEVSDLFAAKAENAEKQKSVDVGSFVYGEDAAIDEALGNLKFYKKLMNGSYKEVAASDLTVEYKKSNETLSAKPEKYTAGDYRFTYGLDGVDQTCDAYFCVEKATVGEFTVTLSETTWKYGDISATAEIKNPSNQAVRVAETLNENDTDCFGVQYYCVKKPVYDAHHATHKTYAALTTNEEDETQPNYPYNKYFGDDLIYYHDDLEYYQTLDYTGKYVLIALIQETYNYEKIVCTTEFTVTDPESPFGKTFVFADLTVIGEGGSAAPDEIVDMMASTKTDNIGKTVVCAQNGDLTGNCDFGRGTFDSLQGNEAMKLLQFGMEKSEHNEKANITKKIPFMFM